MTSDGISTEDWELVRVYATNVSNAVLKEDNQAAADMTQQLLCYLDRLETRYGKLPSILATRADYVTDIQQRRRLLELAHSEAHQAKDVYNLLLTASSLTELFVEELPNAQLADMWLARLSEALGEKWHDEEHRSFLELSSRVTELRLRQNVDPEV